MAIKTFVSRAPTRIDLAGGTVDLWPLFLFLHRPTTINLAIDLFAEVTLQEIPLKNAIGKGVVTLRSEDQNVEAKFPCETFERDEKADIHPGLELHFKLLKYFYKQRKASGGFDLKISTRAKSPAGAGLGGSSTLCVAIIGALSSWAQDTTIDPERDGEKFVEIARDVETTVIQVPAGMQDYYGAMYGGLQSLYWKPAIHSRKSHSFTIAEGLEDRLLLFYSGQSRNSGINNWALFKSFIDKQSDVRKKFEDIVKATHDLELALDTKNWNDVGKAIEKEWATRRTLATGITTPEIDRAFELAKKVAPVSGKVCGAGGGGCFFVFLPEGEKKAEIQKIFSDLGIRPLPFKAVDHGVEVKISRE